MNNIGPADRTSLTRWTVDFPLGGGDQFRVPQIDIRQAQGAHDVAVIRIPGKLTAVEKTFTTGAPVKITWRNRWSSNRFIGYVHHVQAHYGAEKYSTRLVCVGASFPLITVKQRTFSNMTADHVVRQIAAEHGLLAITEPHPRVYESIPQPTISDWSLLCRLAAETGYVLRAEQTRLVFLSRATVASQNKPMAHQLLHSSNSAQSAVQTSQIYDFDPILADYLPELGISNTRKAVRAVDPSGQAVVLENGTASSNAMGIFTKPIDVVANSVQDAEARLAATMEAARFVHRARATTVGIPTIAPEKILYLDGLPRPYAGYWTVLSVTHRLKNAASYTMSMELGSERLDPAPMKPGQNLSPQSQGLIAAKDISQYQLLRVFESESKLDTLPRDVDKVVGKPFDTAVWKSTVLTEV